MGQAEASIIVAIIVAIQVIVQSLIASFSSKKIKKQSDIQEETKQLVTDLKEDSQKRDSEIIESIKEDRLMNDKRWLLDFLNRRQNGEEMAEEQIRMAYETKKRYNDNGGDSYIDDFWDKLKEKNLF